MPGLLDKVLINEQSTKGNHAAIVSRYESLKQLGNELKELDILKDAEPVKEKMKLLCEAHDKADAKYLAGLDACIKELAEIIDKHVMA